MTLPVYLHYAACGCVCSHICPSEYFLHIPRCIWQWSSCQSSPAQKTHTCRKGPLNFQSTKKHTQFIYFRYGDICEILIFARRTNSRIQESRENYFYNSALKKKIKIANSKLREKSQNQKFAKIQTHEN